MRRRHAIRLGLGDSWAVGLGLVPLGVAFGLLVSQMGFAWWWAPIFSLVIYAGSMEFLALGMITSGTSWVTSAITGFLVNFRHIFYGLTYPRHRISNGMGRAYVTYALTDEVYAITSPWGSDGVDRAGRPISSTRLLTISVFCQSVWVVSGIAGALGGAALQFNVEGLEFALTALFVVLAYEAFQNNKDFSLPVIAMALGALAAVMFPSQLLLVALTAYFVILLIRFYNPKVDAWLEWRRDGTS